MSLLIGFLTFVLVVNCLFLMLLILIQLPKKEAGAGIAFGGAATDALFGAGSGNALTKLTKYTASLFVVLSVVLSVLNLQQKQAGSNLLERELKKQSSGAPSTALPAAPKFNVQSTPEAPTTTNLALPMAPASNLMSAPSQTPAGQAATKSQPAPSAPAPANSPAPTGPAKK
jgi:protein translocase SecG subunit